MAIPSENPQTGPQSRYLHLWRSGRSRFEWVARWIGAMRREYREGELDNRAMSLVYTSLLSLAPLLAVSFSVLKAFGVHNQLEPFLLHVLAPLGNNAAEITSTFIGFVESIGVGVLGVIGFAMLFYTVIALIEKVESNFNHIWRVSKSRSFARRFSDYLSVILVGPVLVFSAVGLMASLANSAVAQRIIALQPVGLFYYVAGLLLPYVFIIAAFSFVYLFIPNARVRLSAAAGAGLVAGLTWKLVGSLFTFFVAGSASYSAVYSGFAAVILFMLWLYVSWLILLLGGIVAFHLQYPRYLKYRSRQPRLSVLAIEQLALWLMYLIGLRQYRGESALTMHELAEALNLPWESVEAILAQLAQGHLLVAMADNSGAYQLAHDTDGVLLKDILTAVRSAGDLSDFQADQYPNAITSFASLRGSLEQAYAGVLKEATLRDLILERRGKL